ncbi:MAG: hypothetical protein M5U29_07705 [Anaerolineae bacterium]|nr:hypothetical protein [Anaerolineae bacterium]
MRQVFSEDFTVSKRQLGAALIVLGAALLLGAAALTALDGVRLTAIFSAAAGGAGLLIGLTLLPLGDRPA